MKRLTAVLVVLAVLFSSSLSANSGEVVGDINLSVKGENHNTNNNNTSSSSDATANASQEQSQQQQQQQQQAATANNSFTVNSEKPVTIYPDSIQVPQNNLPYMNHDMSRFVSNMAVSQLSIRCWQYVSLPKSWDSERVGIQKRTYRTAAGVYSAVQVFQSEKEIREYVARVTGVSFEKAQYQINYLEVGVGYAKEKGVYALDVEDYILMQSGVLKANAILVTAFGSSIETKSKGWGFGAGASGTWLERLGSLALNIPIGLSYSIATGSGITYPFIGYAIIEIIPCYPPPTKVVEIKQEIKIEKKLVCTVQEIQEIYTLLEKNYIDIYGDRRHGKKGCEDYCFNNLRLRLARAWYFFRLYECTSDSESLRKVIENSEIAARNYKFGKDIRLHQYEADQLIAQVHQIWAKAKSITIN